METLLNSEGFGGMHLHEYFCRFGFGVVCVENCFFLWKIWHSVLTEIKSQAAWTTCSFHCVATNNAAIFTKSYYVNKFKN